MATNQYLFYGVALTTTDETTVLTPAVASSGSVGTVIIKSFRVTNTTGNTPTITITNGTTKIVNTQTLSANASVEILTLPLIVEGGTKLAYTTAGTVSDGVVFGISYLNILKEKTD